MKVKMETTMFDIGNESAYNVTKDSDVKVEYFDIYLTTLFGSMLIVSMVFAIIGNFMTITIILAKPELRKSKTNLFLLNLAIADMMVGILVIPFSLITLIEEKWIFPEWFCDFNFCINCVCITTSIHTLMYIAIHKYIGISKVGYYFDTWKCILMITAAWTWSAIFAVLTTTVFSEIVYKPKTMQCGPRYPNDTAKSLILLAGFQTFNFYIPLGIMAFAYIRIFQIIKDSFEFRRKNSRNYTSRIKQQEHNVLKTLFIVLICYLLCFTPYLFYTFYSSIIKNKEDIPTFLNPLAYSFGCLNSACNPIIYAWRFPDFRREYKNIICRKLLYVLSCGKKGFRRNDNREGNTTYSSREDCSHQQEMSSMCS